MRLVIAVVSLAVGCSTTRSMQIGNADALHRGRHGAPFDVGGLRVSPHSDLRFCKATGDCSDWIPAWNLRVDDVGAWWKDDIGYRWREITKLEVRGFDGLKTTGAILGISALVAAVIPILAVAYVVRVTPRGDGPPARTAFPEGKAAAALAGAAIVAATDEAAVDEPGYWQPSSQPPEAGPRPLFSIPARIRSIASIGVVLDGGTLARGSLVTVGGVARLRLGDFLELGAGMRFATEKADARWRRTRWYVAQGGFHAPITARVALPIGLDIAWGGDAALANQISAPWGLRYTRGHLSATLHPVTPAWVKREGDWKFGVISGLSLGVTL